MSKGYKKVTSEVERMVLVAMSCDLCRKISHKENWTTDCYQVAETTVEFREGSNYPDGGSGTLYDVDICPDCFRDKLIPWLLAEGAAVRETEWDW